MVWVPTLGPLHIYGDNMFVIHMMSKPQSVYKKESNSVCHYALHKLIAMGMFLVGHTHSNGNIADFYTTVTYWHKKIFGE